MLIIVEVDVTALLQWLWVTIAMITHDKSCLCQ